MHKIKSISLGPQHFEHLAVLREQTGWSDSKIMQVLIEQAKVEGKLSLSAQWPAAIVEEPAHV